MEDEAVWDGVDLSSIDVGTSRKPRKLRFNDYQYCTIGEWHMAQLLDAHGVPFTPDVGFTLDLPNGHVRHFVPDFIFNRQGWLWGVNDRKVELVHGFEIKGRATGSDFSERAKENVRLLWEQRHINVKLISDARAQELFRRWQHQPHRRPLPMAPLNLKRL